MVRARPVPALVWKLNRQLTEISEHRIPLPARPSRHRPHPTLAPLLAPQSAQPPRPEKPQSLAKGHGVMPVGLQRRPCSGSLSWCCRLACVPVVRAGRGAGGLQNGGCREAHTLRSAAKVGPSLRGRALGRTGRARRNGACRGGRRAWRSRKGAGSGTVRSCRSAGAFKVPIPLSFEPVGGARRGASRREPPSEAASRGLVPHNHKRSRPRPGDQTGQPALPLTTTLT